MVAPSIQEIDQACQTLSKTDKVFETAYLENGRPEWRTVESSYATIARIIAFQQISTSAATTIWNRVLADFGEITVEKIIEAPEAHLRGHGLSRPKIRHLKSIAEAIGSGKLSLLRISNVDEETAKEELIGVKGIGPWTAEIYLLSALGRMDAFPSSDIGLIESYKLLSGENERRSVSGFATLAESWRPYRGVAAHLLWGWINARRSEKRNLAERNKNV